MSKQSRAKSRRHKKPTGAVATFERSIRYMPEHKLYDMKYEIMNSLHKALCDRRTFRNPEFLELFNSRMWNDLEFKVATKHSISDKVAVVLDLIPKARILCSILKNEEVN